LLSVVKPLPMVTVSAPFEPSNSSSETLLPAVSLMLCAFPASI